MKRILTLTALALATVACGTPGSVPGGESLAAGSAARSGAGTSLQAFPDEGAFQALLARWRNQANERRREDRMRAKGQTAVPAPPSAPAPLMEAAADATGSITNVQTAGVDEGGIVKRHGDHLVVLRRGRLFTVRVGDDRLDPVATVDAFGPHVDPRGAWYDEMLVAGDTVAVIGYSYARGGTELVRFSIDREGGLSYRDTWHLRSNDYYSSRNYAARLIGSTLVLYTPMHINVWNLAQSDAFMPGLRRWTPEASTEFRRILPATRIYRTDEDLDPFAGVALHTVTRCDLEAPDLDCTSIAVLAGPGRVFYVSRDSVFVWTTRRGSDTVNRSAVFRIPLDDGIPSALKTRGVPVDQLSFLHGEDGYLNVLLAAGGAGEGMWGDETNSGELALLRIPLDRFGDGTAEAPASAYRRLPGRVDGAMQNRYIGPWLLYGSAPYAWSRGDRDGAGSTAFALRYADDSPVQALALDHGCERIEAMGGDAILVGSAGADLHFTSVRLDSHGAHVGSVYVQAGAAQGESRTHGFFYRADGLRRGVVGLPVIGQASGQRMQRYLQESAAVLYLRNDDLRLSTMGRLVADAAAAVNDNCRASCVDWYGNARPIFIGDRVFALMGYELVEGQERDGRIVERRRTTFAPGARIAD